MTHNNLRVLVKRGVITEEGFEQITSEAPGENLTYREFIVAHASSSHPYMAGLISRYHGIPIVDLNGMEIHSIVSRLLPEEFQDEHRVIPFAVNRSHISVAVDSPLEKEVLDEIRTITGKRVEQRVYLEPRIITTPSVPSPLVLE